MHPIRFSSFEIPARAHRMLSISGRRWLWVLAGLTWSACPRDCHALASDGRANVDQAILAQLQARGAQAWSELASGLDETEFSGMKHVEMNFVEAGKPTQRQIDARWMVTWDRSASRRLVEYETLGTGTTTRRILNPDYFFYVSKIPTRDPYQLVSCRRLAPGESFRTYEMGDQEFELVLEAGVRVLGVALGEMLDRQDLYRPKLARREAPSSAEPELIRVEFEYLGPENPPRRAGATYWAILNPAAQYRIETAGLRLASIGQDVGQWVTYQASGRGTAAIPKTVTTTLTDKTSRYAHRMRYDLEAAKPSRRAEVEFRLPYYGIPESVLGVAPAPDRTRIVLAGLGVVGLGAAWAVSRSSRQRRSRAA